MLPALMSNRSVSQVFNGCDPERDDPRDKSLNVM